MQKDLYQNSFRNKKITVMGLGLLGRGIQVSAMLAESWAKLTVTDLKTKDQLKTSLSKLKKFKIRYVLGKHDTKDFENVDLIIKSAGVPLDSPYIKHAKERMIPVEMDASLFTKIVRQVYPKVKIVGITGTRGKSMTTALVYHILDDNSKRLGSKVFLGGNMRNMATLPILKKIGVKDIVVLELDSWQCQGFGDNKISPDISIFTNIMTDHMNYYKGDAKQYLSDKSNIYKFQKKSDVFITTKKLLVKLKTKPKAKIVIPNKDTMNSIGRADLHIIGAHNVLNYSLAFEVARQFGLSDKQIIGSLKSFAGLEGRLELVKNNKAIVINDNNATTPEAMAAGIKAVREEYPKNKVILIAGGSDKMISLSPIIKEIKKVDKLILLPGSGTNKLIAQVKRDFYHAVSLKDAVEAATRGLKFSDVILFSPGFASFGLFRNEYDRNDQFLKLIKKWK